MGAKSTVESTELFVRFLFTLVILYVTLAYISFIILTKGSITVLKNAPGIVVISLIVVYMGENTFARAYHRLFRFCPFAAVAVSGTAQTA